MPPKKNPPGRPSTRKTRQSTRRREVLDDGIPNVYGEMLAEAVADEQESLGNVRSSKRRKISEEPPSKIELDFDLFGSSEVTPNTEQRYAIADDVPPKLQLVVFDDFEGSDESEVEFEDVELEPTEGEGSTSTKPEQQPLKLDLSGTNLEPSRRGVQRRRPVGPAERKVRLEVHKAHLVCLLAHLSSRNRWCESESVQAILKPLVPRKVIYLLHVDESNPQYQRSHSFMKGIEEICNLWRQLWTITAKGMQRAYWKEDADAVKESDDAEDLIDFDDFKAAARTRAGSRDIGAQLFCALLRTVAVDTRLVCSLQALPFSGAAKGQTPEKPKPQYYQAPPQNYTQTSTITRPERTTPKKKKIVESPYPIFWVEVYSPSTAKWIPLDPIVRNTIDKPKTGFEPPASDRLNSMSYVIAFEDDGSAKDVTRRYAQWYNAKTRRQRVESTKGGDQWWARTMSALHKPFSEVRDEIEDASLLRRAESEAMPRNVQDFKGHPVYVLERHLRMNEVIHPRHEVGKVTTGSGKNAKLESVFRRRDVHVCRTADAWYRRGRDVKEGEQPLKRVMPKRKRTPEDLEDDDDEANEGMALYAEFQTKFYEPPPVVDGKIPKNAFGNLDVYVPSMIPAGAVHIRHPLAAEAARVLGIDYSDAVTGFVFKGRQGTAVVDGVVVSMQMCNAMINVVEGLESQATEEVEQARSKVILGLWKRWLTALRVRERVHRDYGDREENDTPKMTDVDEEGSTYHDDDDEYGGGFMPELEEKETGPGSHEPNTDTTLAMQNLKPIDQLLPDQIVHQAIVVVRSPHKLPPAENLDPDSKEQAHGTRASEDDGGGFIQEMDQHEAGGFIPEDDELEAGGFLSEVDKSQQGSSQHPQYPTMDDDAEAGGFLPDDVDMPPSAPRTRQVHTNEDAGLAAGFLPEDDGSVVQERVGTTAIIRTGQESSHSGVAENAAATATATVTSNIRANTEVPEQPLGPELESGPATSNTTDLAGRDHSLSDLPVSNPVSDYKAKESPLDPPADLPASSLSQDEQLPPPQSSPSSSVRSQTSLLSHDPDEEDAEPEWLLNSLGEME